MLYNELDVMEYAVTMEDEMFNDEVLIDDIMSELEETSRIIMPLHKLCTSNIDATISDIHLTVFTDNTDTEVYQGIARYFPYDWESGVTDYSIYNIDNNVYIDAWCVFDTWRDITI